MPSEDSDQPGHLHSLIKLRCPHEESLSPKLPIERTAKTLIRLGGCEAQVNYFSQVFWEMQGPWEDVADVLPRNGSVLIKDEKRQGEIVVDVLPDNVPELTETYRLVLTKIVGGAEIDAMYNISTFKIR